VLLQSNRQRGTETQFNNKTVTLERVTGLTIIRGFDQCIVTAVGAD
jgi:acetolactate synthase regulatory subunit